MVKEPAFFCKQKTEPKARKTLHCPGGHLLSPHLATIGPNGLNFRVREGNGCVPAGNATKTMKCFFTFSKRVR